MYRLMQKLITLLASPGRFILYISLLMLPLQAFSADDSKVVLHLSNQHKLHVLVNNISNLRSAYGDRLHIIAVVNGPAVTKFARFSNTEEQIQKMRELGVEISVCSVAMRNRKVLKEQLLEGVSYLEEGGVVKLIELQKQGYAYIKI